MSSLKEWLEEAGVKDQAGDRIAGESRELWQDMIAQVNRYGI